LLLITFATLSWTAILSKSASIYLASGSAELDAAWRTRRARITARTASGLREAELTCDEAGRWRVNGQQAAHLDGCLDLDLESSALTNTLPVHRVVLQDGAPKEIFVGFADGRFADHAAELSTCAITEYFAAQGITLCEAHQAEAGLEACDWIMEVGRRLERGYVLTIDYGHRAAELFDDHHMRGTLLAYQDHRATENYYASPGQQDLTAHVNFTALETWGKRSGLETSGFTSQTAFLLALGQGNEFADLYDEGQGEAERAKARLQLKTLIHPEGMGERFQVLIQQKGVSEARLAGLSGIAART
jgi:SAM-dependent MidA family methyltransferase